mmetsp:Transcript_61203/g.113603  ORF Transcript_61203/g.113603 Transcript_61203/m.113603 type:complete len:679 (+) Transcript_61203:73-2109(+)
MKVVASVLVLLTLACCPSPAAAETLAAKVTPVEKVLQMLNGMVAKGEQEKHEEQVQFAAYKQFCDDTSVLKERAIQQADDAIEMLQADIAKYGADSERLVQEIAGHDADIAAWTGDMKAAAKVRELEVADYSATHQDYSESVEALREAIQVLKAQSFSRSQASSLTQLKKVRDLNFIPKEARKALEVFLEQDPEESLNVVAPEAAAYEFRSHGIVEMLEKLLDKFIDERTDLEKAELNSKHAHDLLVQDLTDQTNQAKEDRGNKAQANARALQDKAESEGSLSDTQATREDDAKYLSDLKATCSSKATDFEQRQKLREEELLTLQKAIGILSSPEVAGHAEKYLPSMLQNVHKKSQALVQIRSEGSAPAQQQVAQYLQEQAGRLHSRILSTMAAHASDDPFEKVKKMIKDLIVRLMEEANEEAEHKGWCDTELATNEQTRKEKTAAVEKLHAEIDELEASIAKLTEDITQLTEDVAALEKAMAEATTLRQEEKANNTQTIADAKEAQTAVAAALTVLKEFYAKAGEATALMQQQPVAPEIFDSPYKGMQAENGGVIGMLEVIQSDFARLESDTAAAEAAAQKAYDEFMTTSEVDKAQKTKDIEHKTAKKQDHEQMLIVKKEDLEGTQKELDAALAYYDKLKPSCVDAGVSYEDRVARRKEEIESLQEALRILNGEELP